MPNHGRKKERDHEVQNKIGNGLEKSDIISHIYHYHYHYIIISLYLQIEPTFCVNRTAGRLNYTNLWKRKVRQALIEYVRIDTES
jgi:hypothetical protein